MSIEDRMSALLEKTNTGETNLRNGKDRDPLSKLDPTKPKQDSTKPRSVKQRMESLLNKEG